MPVARASSVSAVSAAQAPSSCSGPRLRVNVWSGWSAKRRSCGSSAASGVAPLTWAIQGPGATARAASAIAASGTHSSTRSALVLAHGDAPLGEPGGDSRADAASRAGDANALDHGFGLQLPSGMPGAPSIPVPLKAASGADDGLRMTLAVEELKVWASEALDAVRHRKPGRGLGRVHAGTGMAIDLGLATTIKRWLDLYCDAASPAARRSASAPCSCAAEARDLAGRGDGPVQPRLRRLVLARGRDRAGSTVRPPSAAFEAICALLRLRDLPPESRRARVRVRRSAPRVRNGLARTSRVRGQSPAMTVEPRPLGHVRGLSPAMVAAATSAVDLYGDCPRTWLAGTWPLGLGPR